MPKRKPPASLPIVKKSAVASIQRMASGGGGGLTESQVISLILQYLLAKIHNTSVDYLVLPDIDVVVVNAVPITITLEAFPQDGRWVSVKDAIGSSNLGTPITIDGNGNTIDGDPTTEIKSSLGSLTLVFNQSSNNWIIQ